MALSEEEKKERRRLSQKKYAERTEYAANKAYQKRTGYAAQRKYDQNNTKAFSIKFAYSTDGDLINYLSGIQNRNDYLRKLIRADMAAAHREHRTRIIPYFSQKFAAGPGEPDLGLGLEEYEIPENQRGDFAVQITGDSMEPWLPDGSIQIGVRETPRDGDIAAVMVDGAFYVKQVCLDYAGTLHLFSLNRDRRDADVEVKASSTSTVRCFGKILTRERHELPID